MGLVQGVEPYRNALHNAQRAQSTAHTGIGRRSYLFLLIEIITRRKPSDKVLEVAQTIGMILLIALMILAFGNDIRGLFT